MSKWASSVDSSAEAETGHPSPILPSPRYDPRVLERVRMDEDFAAAAARASGGRPTYCDNRYYRAVANGGQGKSILDH